MPWGRHGFVGGRHAFSRSPAQLFMVSAPAVVTCIGEARKPTAARRVKRSWYPLGDPFCRPKGYDGPTKGADRRNLAVSQPDTTVSLTLLAAVFLVAIVPLSGYDL